MQIVFRLNYRSVPGQRLEILLTDPVRRGKGGKERVLPMRWIHEHHWQAEWEMPDETASAFSYRYRLHQEWNAVDLDEWGAPRCADPAKAAAGVLFLHDTWRSAGCIDHIFATKAFDSLLPQRGPFGRPTVPRGANHEFRLHMVGVPAGMVPCLAGADEAVGAWDLARALPMRETAPDQWHVAVRLPQDRILAYKYGLQDRQSGRLVELEQGPDRLLGARHYGGNQRTLVHDEGYRRHPWQLPRAAGVAVPVFSLRSEQGLGTGEFADLAAFGAWAAAAGMRMIQILPVNDTTSAGDWTDSYPYSAISAFALHPMYLRIDDLSPGPDAAMRAEIDAEKHRLNALATVDYEEVTRVKESFTRRVFRAHRDAIVTSESFRNFVAEHGSWAVSHAVFRTLRDRFGTGDFAQWGASASFDEDRVRAAADPSHPDWPEVSYHLWIQCELDRQFREAVDCLHGLGLVLKGDLPIGVDRHSVEAWSAPHLFHMDAQTGAPPDAFGVKGQNWGFPTYDWEAMAADGYAWWRSRFEQLSRYFDAYRIDHILGFFRIWRIPADQTEGILGWFDPAMPVHVDEIRGRGIPFDFNRFCRPYIREHFLHERFGPWADEVRENHLESCGWGYFRLREGFTTQRAIEDHFAGELAAVGGHDERLERIRDGLKDCVADLLLLEVPGSNGVWFHPRASMHLTKSFQELDEGVRQRLHDLATDYFHRRQEDFWQARGYEKLPAMRRASRMLLCGEDLGMVPACVPGVMRELGILSLEIQRMPKSSQHSFSDPAHAPYLSVVSPSTHDMPTVRGWWREDPAATSSFAWHALGVAFPPLELSGETAAKIIAQHLASPAMWAVFPLQDLLAADETLRHPDPDAERINVPAINPYYWRYRMHLPISALREAAGFTERMRELVTESGRL
jgi:4-alpha-glucanotransferase